MKRLAILSLLCLLWSSGAEAQNTPVTEDHDCPEAIAIPEIHHKIFDRKMVVLAGAMHGAMLFDGKTTFDSLGRNPRIREEGVFATSFVNHGPLVAYAAGTAFQAGVIYISDKMRHSKNPAARRIWWVPAVAIAVVHIKDARHNLTVH